MKVIDLIKCCLNPKVIIGIILLIGGAFLFLPKGQVTSLAPILVALICPVSMGLMMIGMKSIHEKEPPKESNLTITNSTKKV